MIRPRTRFVASLATAAILLSLTTAALAQVAGEWKAPAAEVAKRNPLRPAAPVLEAGRKAFELRCQMCHGPQGKGDGPAGILLNPRPRDFSQPDMARRTDGELFWKIGEGRGAMPPMKTVLADQDRWSVILYVRTLMRPGAARSGK